MELFKKIIGTEFTVYNKTKNILKNLVCDEGRPSNCWEKNVMVLKWSLCD